jgi:hypothetical protein
MRNEGGGIGGYVWAVLTGLMASLTPQDIMFGLGALVTAILGLLTYLSNDRRNKRIAAAEEARNEILKRYFANHDSENLPARDRETLDVIQEIDA